MTETTNNTVAISQQQVAQHQVLYDYNEDGEAVAAINDPYPIRETGWDDCDHFYLDWFAVPPYFGITETGRWVDRNGRWQEGPPPPSIIFKPCQEYDMARAYFSHTTIVD